MDATINPQHHNSGEALHGFDPEKDLPNVEQLEFIARQSALFVRALQGICGPDSQVQPVHRDAPPGNQDVAVDAGTQLNWAHQDHLRPGNAAVIFTYATHPGGKLFCSISTI